MWIKASGTLLAKTKARDIFVAVDLAAMRAGLSDPDTDADQPQGFTLANSELRPSIETSLHAEFNWRVIVHVHCVNTLAHVVRKDADEILMEKLAGFDWCHVPYVRLGALLARKVRARLGPTTNILSWQITGCSSQMTRFCFLERLGDRFSDCFARCGNEARHQGA